MQIVIAKTRKMHRINEHDHNKLSQNHTLIYFTSKYIIYHIKMGTWGPVYNSFNVDAITRPTQLPFSHSPSSIISKNHQLQSLFGGC
jgi:hypothetical protein